MMLNNNNNDNNNNNNVMCAMQESVRSAAQAADARPMEQG
jgi:hypothetical protein